MNIKTMETLVGAFVVISILALLMLALQVSGLSDFYKNNNGYKIKAAFANIGGLKIRSRVTIGGVIVGRVTDIKLQQNAYDEYQAIVSMVIDANMNNIPNDSTASILTSGLLGDNYIGIMPGNSEQYLKDGDIIEFTSQALLLEDLISKFAVGGNNGKK